MTNSAVALPDYAEAIAPGKINVDAGQFYEFWLGQFGVSESDVDEYYLEMALACMKLDIQLAVEGTELAPTPGGALVINIQDDTKIKRETAEDEPTFGKWAMKNFPHRKFDRKEMAKEAKQRFQLVRRALPMGFDVANTLRAPIGD